MSRLKEGGRKVLVLGVMVDKAFGANTFAVGSIDGACTGVAGIIAGGC